MAVLRICRSMLLVACKGTKPKLETFMLLLSVSWCSSWMTPSLHVADLTSPLFSPSGGRVKRWPHLHTEIKSPAINKSEAARSSKECLLKTSIICLGMERNGIE